MSKQDIVKSVVAALEEMDCDVTVDQTRRHPQVRWTDRLTGTRGMATVPKTTSDHRAMLNNVRMVQRMVRLGRS